MADEWDQAAKEFKPLPGNGSAAEAPRADEPFKGNPKSPSEVSGYLKNRYPQAFQEQPSVTRQVATGFGKNLLGSNLGQLDPVGPILEMKDYMEGNLRRPRGLAALTTPQGPGEEAGDAFASAAQMVPSLMIGGGPTAGKMAKGIASEAPGLGSRLGMAALRFGARRVPFGRDILAAVESMGESGAGSMPRLSSATPQVRPSTVWKGSTLAPPPEAASAPSLTVPQPAAQQATAKAPMPEVPAAWQPENIPPLTPPKPTGEAVHGVNRAKMSLNLAKSLKNGGITDPADFDFLRENNPGKLDDLAIRLGHKKPSPATWDQVRVWLAGEK